jgi:hypothetical protein
MPKQTAFISYSRRNKEFVDRVASDLSKAGFSIWRDSENLSVGTPSWEKAIREAIKQAEVVVLIASPDSLTSDYVQGELALAKIYHRPIYPIWADGNQWIECVPLDMVNYQYVDGRGDYYSQGIKELISNLSKISDLSEGTIEFGLPTHEIIELNLAQFENTFSILSYIWLNYLQDWYEVMSYGKEWVIANVNTKQIALPWQWLKMDLTDPNAVYELSALSGAASYTQFGITRGSYWAVWDARRLKITGLFLNDDQLMHSLLSTNGTGEIALQLKQGKLKRKKLVDVVPNSFKYKIVIAALNHTDDRAAIIEV